MQNSQIFNLMVHGESRITEIIPKAKTRPTSPIERESEEDVEEESVDEVQGGEPLQEVNEVIEQA